MASRNCGESGTERSVSPFAHEAAAEALRNDARIVKSGERANGRKPRTKLLVRRPAEPSRQQHLLQLRRTREYRARWPHRQGDRCDRPIPSRSARARSPSKRILFGTGSLWLETSLVEPVVGFAEQFEAIHMRDQACRRQTDRSGAHARTGARRCRDSGRNKERPAWPERAKTARPAPAPARAARPERLSAVPARRSRSPRYGPPRRHSGSPAQSPPPRRCRIDWYWCGLRSGLGSPSIRNK